VRRQVVDLDRIRAAACRRGHFSLRIMRPLSNIPSSRPNSTYSTPSQSYIMSDLSKRGIALLPWTSTSAPAPSAARSPPHFLDLHLHLRIAVALLIGQGKAVTIAL